MGTILAFPEMKQPRRVPKGWRDRLYGRLGEVLREAEAAHRDGDAEQEARKISMAMLLVSDLSTLALAKMEHRRVARDTLISEHWINGTL
jgi:hypothetical protein